MTKLSEPPGVLRPKEGGVIAYQLWAERHGPDAVIEAMMFHCGRTMPRGGESQGGWHATSWSKAVFGNGVTAVLQLARHLITKKP